MAEYAYVPVQTVAQGQHVLYQTEVIHGTPCIYHRDGSGMVTVKGMTEKCKARYRVHFDGNVGIPTGTAITPVGLAIAVNGETLSTSMMITTPVAVDTYFNVSTEAQIEVPRGCCTNVSVVNTSAADIAVQNANLIVERIG